MIIIRSKIIESNELKYTYEVFEDARIINKDKGKEIKYSPDKRRPGTPPLVYFKRCDGGRNMFRLDELVAQLFIENYDCSLKIVHIDGDVENCELSNLKLMNPLEYVRDVLHNDDKWIKIQLDDVDLFYDYYVSENGEVFNGTTFSKVKPFVDARSKFPVIRVKLYIDQRCTVNYTVSRLVAMHFIPNNSEDKTSVYFIDGDHENLHYSNLAWGSRDDVLHNAIMNAPDKTDLHINIIGNEKWVPVNIGVKLYYDYYISNFGRAYNKNQRKILSLSRGTGNVNNQSWLFVNLRLEDGSFRKFLVHRLVAMHFIPNDDPGHKTEINHINGNPEFNVYFNLEWCTPEQNASHAISTNLLHSKGFDHRVDDIDWRTRSIMAWISAIVGITDDDRYEFYVKYVKTHEPLLTILSSNNFKNYHQNHYSKDNDYTKLYDFYHEYYTLDMSSTTRES